MKNRIEELKKKWRDRLYLDLYDTYAGYTSKGYNNNIPEFDTGYCEFALSDNLIVELKPNDVHQIGYQYADGYHLYHENYSNFRVQEKYDMIWNTQVFKELRSFLENTFNSLVDDFSRFVYHYEMENYEDNSWDDDIFRDACISFIQTWLNDNLK